MISVKCRLKLKLFFTQQLWTYFIVFSSIILCSWLFDRWFEGIAFCIAHYFIRPNLDYTYHSKSHCLQLTLFIVWCCIPNTLNLTISLLSAIPIAFFICWIGCIFEEKTRKTKELIDIKTEKLKYKFNTETCTKKQLLIRCQELRFSKENTELAIEFFINKTKQSIIAEKLCIEELSVARQKLRLKQKLNKIT